jgi:hypothetical protein
MNNGENIPPRNILEADAIKGIIAAAHTDSFQPLIPRDPDIVVQQDDPSQEQAWARALDDIGAILDRYAGGPSPRYAYSALLAIKAIVEEVKP